MIKGIKKILIVALIIVLALADISLAVSSSESYRITLGVVDAGGGPAASGSYRIHGKTRERTINILASSSFSWLEGFIISVYLRMVQPDNIPPARITDLVAQSGANPREITLTWTAVGDDGNSGKAAKYIVRYSREEITSRTIFDSATTYSQNWAPAAPGSIETMVLTGLREGDFIYFAVVAVDEAGNQGELSSSPSVVVTVSPDRAAGIIGPPVHSPTVFNPDQGTGLTIEYRLTKDVDVQFIIFNISGALIWKRSFAAGTPGGSIGINQVIWDGRTDFNELIANGVYVYHILIRENGELKSLGRGKIAVFR